MIDTNVTGTLYLLHTLVRRMRERRAGRVLITGSIAGFMPGTFHAVYNGTKAFLDSFSWVLRSELEGSGVTVTCLMPGATDTGFFARAGLTDTRLAQQKKDDPARVARLGFDAMMAGEGRGDSRPGLRLGIFHDDVHAGTLQHAVPILSDEERPAMTTPEVETLDPQQVSRLLDTGKILLIDVREPSEFATERIAGALLYPLSTFDAARLPPDEPRRVVFHCGSGKRSLTAAQRRLAAGLPHAAHLGGGLAAWKAAGLPVIAIDPATGTPR